MKLVDRVKEFDICWLIEHHPDLSDTAIMSFVVYGSINSKTEAWV